MIILLILKILIVSINTWEVLCCVKIPFFQFLNKYGTSPKSFKRKYVFEFD